uniref:SPRY domain-containing protein n=1 Tax=Globodera pallida TaxID=36090 RepID=A0A183BKC4_GLOPA
MKQIDPFQIAGSIVLFIFVICTVHQLNKQNAIVVAELRGQKQSNANKFAEIEQKNDKLEQYQNEQQPNIVHLQKTVAVLCETGLINRWDSDCHDALELTQHRLVAQHFGENSVWHSVRAEKPMAENPCFEVQIVVEKGRISIGLAIERMPLDKSVGNLKYTYAYESDGTFWGHEVAGCDHTDEGRPFIDGKPKFGVYDVIGCGVNLETGQIIYMLNGLRLDTTGCSSNLPTLCLRAFRWTCLAPKFKQILAPISNFHFKIADEI